MLPSNAAAICSMQVMPHTFHQPRFPRTASTDACAFAAVQAGEAEHSPVCSSDSPAQCVGVHTVGKAVCWLKARVAALGGHQVRVHMRRDREEGCKHHHPGREGQHVVGQLQAHPRLVPRGPQLRVVHLRQQGPVTQQASQPCSRQRQCACRHAQAARQRRCCCTTTSGLTQTVPSCATGLARQQGCNVSILTCKNGHDFQAHLEHKMGAASALSHSEADASREVHGLGALRPAIQHMAARLLAHAVGVAVPHPVWSCRLRTSCMATACMMPGIGMTRRQSGLAEAPGHVGQGARGKLRSIPKRSMWCTTSCFDRGSTPTSFSGSSGRRTLVQRYISAWSV